MLIQPSRYKGVGCCSVASCHSLGTNTDEMWCFVPQLLFENLAAAVGLIWHPPSYRQVLTCLFNSGLSTKATWYEPFLPKGFHCTPHPYFCATFFLSGTGKGLGSAAVLSAGACCCILKLLQKLPRQGAAVCVFSCCPSRGGGGLTLLTGSTCSLGWRMSQS